MKSSNIFVTIEDNIGREQKNFKWLNNFTIFCVSDHSAAFMCVGKNLSTFAEGGSAQ